MTDAMRYERGAMAVDVRQRAESIRAMCHRLCNRRDSAGHYGTRLLAGQGHSTCVRTLSLAAPRDRYRCRGGANWSCSS
jgi:hypothetical protein